MFGYTSTEFLEGLVPYAETVHAEDLTRVAEEVAAATARGAENFEHLPYRVVHRSGRPVWLYDFTTILRDDLGNATHFLGYVIDITSRREAEEERKRLEAQVLQSQKLESLGVLAGGIAHDFNNLLTTILAHSELAQISVTRGESVDSHLEAITIASERAADLCRQMLAYSGRGRFEIRPLDLNAVVREMAYLLEVSISKNVTMTFDLSEDLPGIEGDVTQLRQVVMNLITNASEAIGNSGGGVQLVTESIRLEDRCVLTAGVEERLPSGDYVRLRVTDDGCGMSEETAARIFEPFFSTKFTGRGLGLAAVLGIIRGHHGAIEVRSSPDEGTTIEVLLPVAQSRAEVPVTRDASCEEWTSSGRVLVIDDEEMVIDVASLILESAGLDVVSAPDGSAGIRQLRELGDDLRLVLLDLTMPGLSGDETFAELRAISPSVPIVLMSGYDEDEVAGRFADSKPDGFVHKPFLREQLLAGVRQALDE